MSLLLIERQAKIDECFCPGLQKFIKLRIDGHIVGIIDVENRVYRTRKVVFRNFQGLSLSYRVLTCLEECNINRVQFDFGDYLLEVDISKYYVYGEEYLDNHSNEKQLVLNLKFFYSR